MKTSAPKVETNDSFFSTDDAFDIKDVSSPALSPDGKQVAYVVTVPSLEENDRTDHIALRAINAKDEEEAFLTEGSSPCWSPDGQKIAYTAERDDKSGIWLYNLETDEHSFLAPVYSSNYFMGHRAEKNFAWAPNGQKIAYLSTKPYSSNGHKSSVRVFNSLLYKSKGGRGRSYYSDQHLTHIWTISVNGGDPELITPGEYNEHSISWSPDSQDITFISNRSADREYNHLNDVWSVNVETQETTRLTDDQGTEFTPKWSPDGNYIAYLATKSKLNTKDSQSDDTHLYIKPADGGKARCLTRALDRRIENISWHPQEQALYFTAGDKGQTGIYKVSVDSGDIETVLNGPFHILEYYAATNGERIAYTRTDPTHPAELFIYNHQDEAKPLTNHNASLVADSHLQDAETFWFKSFDDVDVQGWLIKPAGFEPSKTYPLVLVIHGGPHNMFGYEFEARMQLLASHGYGVVFINPRGSTGYGQHFSRGCVLNWGGGDYKDLMHGIDYVVDTHSWVDEDRLGVTGQSYGGYMTNWIITQTSRFKAAVSDGGISNLISFTGTSLYHLLLESEFNGAPWDNYPLLWQWSPLREINEVDTPTLFVHGEADNEVPTAQSEEMFTALKKRGVETTFVHYIGEGHGWRPDLKPQNRHDLYHRTISWFDTHIK